MLLPDTATRDDAGRLWIGGCAVAALAATHGTPLYILDEQTVRRRLRDYRDGVRAWPAGGQVLYSAKAYLGAAMVQLLVEEDCGVDVVSGGELAIALQYGMPASRIGFPGNNKDAAEVRAAWEQGIGHLVVDSMHELDLCASLPSGRPLRVLLRLSPGVAPQTHAYISTGQLDSKFGFPVAGGAAATALHSALATAALDVAGVHMHIGSQITDLQSYGEAIREMVDFLAGARQSHGFVARAVSVGGGLGIAHTAADVAPAPAEFMTFVATSLRDALAAASLPVPELYVEPGRSVVGPAGVAVYTVGSRKDIPGLRSYVALDGGMADNIRPSLYDATYEPIPVIEDGALPRETVTLAGRYCESSDILVRDVYMQRLVAGDLVAVPAAGAYTLSMSSNYNAAVRPAVVLVAAGSATLVRRRETVEDLVACEIARPRGSRADDGRSQGRR